MRIPNHITELKRADFEEIARSTKLPSGRGIRIAPQNDSIKIEIDENEFKRMIWAFLQNGGRAQGSTYQNIDDIPLDVS